MVTRRCIKYASWNINGSGNPVKRRKVLSYLKTNMVDVAFVQETHLNEGEAQKLKTSWVKYILYSSFSSSRNEVMILVDRNTHFVLLKDIKDAEGRLICVQVDLHFVHEMKKVLGEMEGQIILAGDFNQVMDLNLDKGWLKGPQVSQDREARHMLTEAMGLVDIWRLVDPQEREYMYIFPHSTLIIYSLLWKGLFYTVYEYFVQAAGVRASYVCVRDGR